MRINTKRQRAVKEALSSLIPRAPLADFEAIAQSIRAAHMRDLAPRDAVFLATIAHIRHTLTEYDQLIDDGYDRDAARFFIRDDINAVLQDWGSSRQIGEDGHPGS